MCVFFEIQVKVPNLVHTGNSVRRGFSAIRLIVNQTSVLKNKNVKVIWLRVNNITELNPELALCTKLEELSLGSNPIKDMQKNHSDPGEATQPH